MLPDARCDAVVTTASGPMTISSTRSTMNHPIRLRRKTIAFRV
jgi:hypothetical protein